jgi:hypothetical protein
MTARVVFFGLVLVGLLAMVGELYAGAPIWEIFLTGVICGVAGGLGWLKGSVESDQPHKDE